MPVKEITLRCEDRGVVPKITANRVIERLEQEGPRQAMGKCYMVDHMVSDGHI